MMDDHYKNNVTQGKYQKFVRMTKEKKTVKEIKEKLKMNSTEYDKYWNTYIFSTQDKKKKVKEVVIKPITLQPGRLDWVTDIFRKTNYYHPNREVI